MSIISSSALRNSIFNLIHKFVPLVCVYFHVKMIFCFLTNGLTIEVFTHVDKHQYFSSLRVGVLSLQSCLTLCDAVDFSPPGSSVHGILQARNTGVGCHFLLQGIFPTQGSTPRLLCLLHWQTGSLPRASPNNNLGIGFTVKSLHPLDFTV